MSETNYRGRFAPTPSGLLHAGSLATALGSWLDARAARGRWLIRMEDLDTPRNEPGAGEMILSQLAKFGLTSDEPVRWQSQHIPHYENVLQRLIETGYCYACRCSRKEIEEALAAQGIVRQRHQELIYPGTCRHKPWGRALSQAVDQNMDQNLNPDSNRPIAWRAKIPLNTIIDDQDLNHEVGDFVLKRADGIFSYQLAVVVDDFEQEITDVVRGADLLDNTPRQLWLQDVLGYPHPHYRHLPLVLNEDGEKLSKQTHAPVLDPQSEQDALLLLCQAARNLGLEKIDSELGSPTAVASMTVAQWLERATRCWVKRPP